MRYLGFRFIRSILLLLGVSLLCFLFTEIAPGSFFDEMRLNPQISPETISAMEARYGLDQPWPDRYWRWFDLSARGTSAFPSHTTCRSRHCSGAAPKNALLLTISAMVLTWIVSVPVGVWAAVHRGRFADHMVTVVSALVVAIPEVVIALSFLAIAVRWRILPVGGMASVDSDGLSFLAKQRDIGLHMLLPTLILVIVESAIIVRHVRASVLEVLEAPYVHAARALGISQVRLLLRHVLPVAADPAITLLGLSLAGLLSGSLLVEVVCGWPGLGPLILEATLARDLYLVIGGLMLSALFMVGGGLFADALLLLFDPRIRTGGVDAH